MDHALKWGSMPLEDKNEWSIWKDIPNKKSLMPAIFKNSKACLLRKVFIKSKRIKQKNVCLQDELFENF